MGYLELGTRRVKSRRSQTSRIWQPAALHTASTNPGLNRQRPKHDLQSMAQYLNSSSPVLFDPAIHLHSETFPEPLLPPSHSNSDDLEALHIQQQELTDAKIEAGIVIQHRSWKLQEVLRSEDIFNPSTPSKQPVHTSITSVPENLPLESSPKMPLISSPILYPPSSSPPLPQKRKLFRTLEVHDSKRRKVIGGFVDDGDEEEGSDTMATLGCGLLDRAKSVEAALPPVTPSSPFEVVPRASSPSLPPPPCFSPEKQLPQHTLSLRTSSGKDVIVPVRAQIKTLSYEEMIAQRSTAMPGRAKKAYYGIDIHELMDDAGHHATIKQAEKEARTNKAIVESIENPPLATPQTTKKPTIHQMWTEKYRARKFTDLIGDERTHRSVLRWLKSWDHIVFPGSTKMKAKKVFGQDGAHNGEQQHRKIMLLTGPPGLGKTTLAHVCARQAGYEILEINASDDRSREIVKGRIKDALGTENVRGIKEHNKTRKAGRPVCVVVDEVDGVVSGSSASGGEGGFMKALIDLVQLDHKISNGAEAQHGKKRTGERFKLLRPLIMVCNDIYAPSLRPLRNSSVAEIIHVRKPPLDKVISRLRTVFDKEQVPCDNDAIRRLCESTWGIASRGQGGISNRGAGDGDIRGVLVQGEWIAHKLRAANDSSSVSRLTREWLETHVLGEESQCGSGARGLGRGGTREVVERVFLQGAGLPNLPTRLSKEEACRVAESKANPIGVADLRKRVAINALREMVDTCAEHDRLMTDCFTTYPSQVFQDDTVLSKPNAGYEWLHFHDQLSTRVFGGQEWELNPYLSSGVCGFHHLFAGVDKAARGRDDGKQTEDKEVDEHPFSGPRADFAAFEAEKESRATISDFQSSFQAPMLRLFPSSNTIALELIPTVGKMLAPDVKPIVVGGSGGQGSVASVRKETEKKCVMNAARVMTALNVRFEKIRVETEGGGAHSYGGFAYRMEP